VVDAVKEGVSGYLVEPGDYHGFAGRVLEHLQMASPLVTQESCMDYAKGFSWERFGEQLREICAASMSNGGQVGPLSI
jgi:phosphatidylinositol alpha-1,6-mannosyltransferase